MFLTRSQLKNCFTVYNLILINIKLHDGWYFSLPHNLHFVYGLKIWKTKILEKPSSPQVTSRKSFSLQRQCSTSRCSKSNETVQLNKSFSVVVSPSGVIYCWNLIGDCKLKEHNTSLLDFDIICRSDKCIIHTEENLYPVDSVKCCSVSFA